MDTIKYCCERLNEMIKNAGSKGFSILLDQIVIDKKMEHFFVLQYRNLEREDTDGKLSIGQVAIHFCPWCGTKLSNVIMKNGTKLVELYNKNKDLLIPMKL